MKLIIYNMENSRPEKEGKRTIHVDSKNGSFIVSAQAVKMCKLKDGDRIIIANDSDNPKEWFFGKTNDESGFILRKNKKCLKMGNKIVTKMIISSLKLDRSATFLISMKPQNIDGIDYYSLITSRPIINKIRKVSKGIRKLAI